MTRAALVASCGLLVASCGGDPEPVSLVVELAPVREDLRAEEGCTVDPDREPAALIGKVSHIALKIWRYSSDGRSMEAVRLVVSDGDHENAGTEVLVPLGAGRFEVDARLGGGPHRVEVVACDGTTPFASGVAEDARLGSGSVRVRLYRYQDVSCAGPRQNGRSVALPLPRALHAATALPNGDVLIYGGITGSVAPTASGPPGNPMWDGATLQGEIEVYDVSEERFFRVEGGELRRVLFASALLPAAGDGRYVVRVVGGITAEGDRPAIRFDTTQGRQYLGAPLLPVEGATVGTTVDLVYDPATRRVEVRDPMIPGLSDAAANAMAPPQAPEGAPAVPGAVVHGLSGAFAAEGEIPAGTWMSADPPSWPTPRPRFWFLGADGTMASELANLAAGRFGHSVTTIPQAAPTALVWGGNVHETDLTDVESRAGELLRVPGMATAVPGGDAMDLPHPTAFHTATAISDDTILIAGGLRVGCSGGTCGGRGFSTAPADPPLTALRWTGPAAPYFTAVPVTNGPGAAFTPTILHTATPIDEGEPMRRVVLIGGAKVAGATRYEASNQIVTVGAPGVGLGTLELPGTGDGLIHGRWGHAVAPLPGERLLVTGGLQLDGGTLNAIDRAEVVRYGAPPPAAENPCLAASDGGVLPFDAGSEAGTLPDAGPPPDTGPPPDAGTLPDAGPPPDAGMAMMDAGL